MEVEEPITILFRILHYMMRSELNERNLTEEYIYASFKMLNFNDLKFIIFKNDTFLVHNTLILLEKFYVEMTNDIRGWFLS